DPKNAHAHFLVAAKHAMTHDNGYAIHEFEAAIELDPAKLEYYTALAGVQLADGSKAAAEGTLRKGTEVNPTSLAARLDLGQFYFADRKYSDAETETLAAKKLDTKAVAPRLLLARIFLTTGRLAQAEKTCELLKQIAPNDPAAYQALGNLYL